MPLLLLYAIILEKTSIFLFLGPEGSIRAVNEGASLSILFVLEVTSLFFVFKVSIRADAASRTRFSRGRRLSQSDLKWTKCRHKLEKTN
ncbi:wsv030 [White spot syndrome virus]|uniref:Wsv030 n=4 Tax=White spot syndrome virus TaxID=342409 RepID=Q8VBD5_WSSVS|nr:wsv030 [Shrimp white spot syndrome virus]AFX59407.1 wsv030 [White spot syndrome virus]AAL33034.1 wsv030 [Shrimp white spot syndrome virus]AAL88955.1 WSSV087 [Shrimp white spot syndrome virus]AWQ60220.1 wsv030 [Shrimp white spot syndrome virus]AWQ60639.1 wsv030 [Shrimp white spot syndrome virus]